MKRVSLKDIAKLAGVSPSTVSFVLNGKAKQMRISNTLADKIIEVARKEGYHPNQVAVSLRTGKSHMLGLIVESMSGNFFASFARIIEEEAANHGYKVVYCSTENQKQKAHELIRMLSHQQVDGYIVTPTPGMEEDIRTLAELKKPVVLMDSYFPGIDVPYVLVDNFDGVTKGMNHLFEKGYRRIGFVTVDLDLIQMKQRREAYQESVQVLNLPNGHDLMLTIKYRHRPDEAIDQISEFIKKEKPDAVFFATNYLGILGLESFSQAGLNTPGDIAMICFDDHEVFRLLRPGITCIQQPVESIARTAFQLLVDQLNKSSRSGEDGPNKVQFPATLIPRGTT
jgi:LacI family transcriptional regulator